MINLYIPEYASWIVLETFKIFIWGGADSQATYLYNWSENSAIKLNPTPVEKIHAAIAKIEDTIYVLFGNKCTYKELGVC